ncbi:MAG: hypothetical protein ATN36_08640 [Epulopiscium sp. Nele67-Bin005]|nr:MAG: hypothetical protein ATN36_08640 [Epulopiscium sp. Nele67-Bin005]
MNLHEHPAFYGIDARFLQSMSHKLAHIEEGNAPQLISTIMALSEEAKTYDIQMTPERQQILINQLKDYLPAEKRSQFDMFVNMLSAQ